MNAKNKIKSELRLTLFWKVNNKKSATELGMSNEIIFLSLPNWNISILFKYHSMVFFKLQVYILHYAFKGHVCNLQ